MKTALTFVAVSIYASSAFATRAVDVPLTTLTARAELIVEGDADEAESFWVEGRIFTRTPVHVRSVLKGTGQCRASGLACAATISVVTRGGIVDGIGQRVDGEATVEPHTVLFLVYDQRLEGYRVVAMQQGAFAIEDDTRARLTPQTLPAFTQRIRELARAR